MNNILSDKKSCPRKQTTTTVFYDGGCSLCRAEIATYRKMRGAHSVDWVDISIDGQRLEQYALDIDKAMARFHVLDARGRWHTGAFGFAELWRQLPAMRRLALVLERARLLPMLDRLYPLFAKWRPGSKQQRQSTCQ